MILPYDSVSENDIKWLNRILFDGYEFPMREQMEKIRTLDNRLAKEIGWYVKENNKIVSQVCYLIYEIKTKSGIEKTGIPLAVGTLLNYRGRGYAKKLMIHIHNKMKEQDCMYSILATSKRWIAYKWYKKMGYFDLANLGFFYGELENIDRPTWSIRNFDESDEEKLSVLFNEVHEANYGFIKRPPNFIKLRDLWKDQKITIKILEDKGNLIGFVNFNKLAINEISELTIKKGYSLMDWIRFISHGETMIFPSPDQYHQLAKVKNLHYTDSDAILMIKDLSEKKDLNEIYKQIGRTDKLFTCHSFDRF